MDLGHSNLPQAGLHHPQEKEGARPACIAREAPGLALPPDAIGLFVVPADAFGGPASMEPLR